MISVNVSYKSLKSYLDQLVASSLVTIEVEEKRRIVSTTQEGMKAVSLYHNAISSLRQSGLGNAPGKYCGNRRVRSTSSGDS
jgi:predicted transcriptional regulator